MTKPPRLGRGLSSLMGDAPAAPAATPAGAPRTLPVEALEPSPFQARATPDPAALAELAASIQEHGILQPILVRPKPKAPGRYQILGGERRWRAAQQARLHDVPVVIRDLDDRAAMAAGLVENLQREDLNALEEAEGYARLLGEFGLKQEALGQAVGKSRSHVANTLRLLNLPGRVRDLLRTGTLSAGHARALLGAEDPERLAGLVVVRGLSVRQTEALAAAAPRDPAARRATKQDADTAALERRLTERLGLRVGIKPAGKGGQVTITYGDLDQLEGVLRLLDPDFA
ncbi:ParB/RepB/Spo0J family partition protein [Roseomonas sp. CECT 9278]|uniref:ParB/RepB/Spo0J family partition protein n=1 Tax=Roseomonas sp. CECT 9278 TaxID=2845823 RepID=UPI001E5444CD|nr:ParB/RepB/Spo0J family partition protein [Roseomonas sp. CECT 9278]CAH0144430.1 Chromosome-partitioning protein ParB [Roseomonas sp. CECT 9278]